MVVCAAVGNQRIPFSGTNHNLVSDNKARREAAVTMGVTGTGDSSPVVPRRQDGSVGLWTLTLFALFGRRVCVCVCVCVSLSFSTLAKRKNIHLVCFSAVKSDFLFQADVRTREEIRQNQNNAACSRYICCFFCFVFFVQTRQNKADRCSGIS